MNLSVCAKKCMVGSFGVTYSFTVMMNSTSPFLIEKQCSSAISCEAWVCANPQSFIQPSSRPNSPSYKLPPGPAYSRNRIHQFPVGNICEALEPQPLSFAPARVIPPRQQRQILPPLPHSQFAGRDARETLPQLAVQRDRHAFLHAVAESLRLLPVAVADEPHLHRIRRERPGNGHAVEPVHVARQIVAQLQYFLHFFEPLVLPRRVLELHLFAQTVAERPNRLQQRPPVGLQKLHHARHLVPVFRCAHHLLARPQAHPHLAVNAARMLGRWRQIFLASPHLEQVQKLPLEPLRGDARTKRPE